MPDKIIETYKILPESKHTCFVVPALFSAVECQQLLHSNIKMKFQSANYNYPTNYRNNERFVTDNNILSKQLFLKVKPYLPKTIVTKSENKSENGIWHLKELNDRLRFCKYSSGQYFHKHLDGIHYRNHSTQSKLTFMIYLNSASEFKGGRTLFYKNKDDLKLWKSYTPSIGDLIVFDHNLWHEGETLYKGEKFVLRSDILYSTSQEKRSKESFEGHLGYIWTLLKLDKITLLSGGRDKEIKVWSHSGDSIRSLVGHSSSILCLEKLSSSIFISGSRNKEIIVWKNFKILNKSSAHSAAVLSLCRLNNSTFASSSGDKTIKICNIKGLVIKTLHGHTDWVWKVIKLDNSIIATSSEDQTIKIWDYTTGEPIQNFAINEPIISLAYKSETKQLIGGSLSGIIYIRNLNEKYSQQEIKTFKAHNGTIRIIKLLDQGYIATGGEDNIIKIWKFDGTLISKFEHLNFVQSIEQLNRETIISASYDGTIRNWKILDSKENNS